MQSPVAYHRPEHVGRPPGIRDHRGAPETLILETPDNPGGPPVFGLAAHDRTRGENAYACFAEYPNLCWNN